MALAAGALVLACQGKPAAGPAANATPQAEAQKTVVADTGVVHNVTVNASLWKFSPNTIDAKLGDTLTITLKNVQGVHGFKLDEYNIDLTDGKTQTVKLDRKGSFEFYCSIDCGHGHDGMVGTLTVN